MDTLTTGPSGTRHFDCGCEAWREEIQGKLVMRLRACKRDCSVVTLLQEEATAHNIPAIWKPSSN